MSDIANHIAVSGRVDIEDLDWAACKQAGLEPIEIENLKFFADIESQTVYYFLEVAPLKVARDPDILTFLTMWNYEEYFHSHAITKLLVECGVDMQNPTDRSTEVRANARFKAKVEQFAQGMMAKVFPQSFTALWMFWGALQECLTMQAYEQVINTTKNPVLQEMFKRIAKQERRHFAYYFNQARERLAGDEFAQKFVRFIVKRFYAPVGSGVKSEAEGAAQIARMFPGDRLFEVMGYIERRMAQLPGMEDLGVCTEWAKGIQPLLPAAQRAPAFAALAA